MSTPAANGLPSRKLKFAAALIFALLAAPVVIYVYKFGWLISEDHGRWSEMGSAMSGIYTPILSLLTLWVLAAQVRLQSDMNKHAYDQAYLQQVRSDVQFYLSRLTQELAFEFDNGSEISKELVSTFAYPSNQELQSQRYLETAQALNIKFPRIMAIWSAYYARLEGLGANQHEPYRHQFVAIKEMAIALLSYEGCAALDNFIWCVSEGRLRYKFQFATGLETQNAV